MEALSSIIASDSSMVADSTMSFTEQPIEDEEIDDESTDSEIEKRTQAKMRIQSIYNPQSITDSMNEYNPLLDTGKYRHCVNCEKPITDLVIWAMNKPHHCRCLVCFVCKGQIAFRKFKVVEGKLLMCYKDYYESYQVCRICQKPLQEPKSRSYKKLYHEECFKCVNCFNPVTTDGAVDLFDETYCSTCAEHVLYKKKILQKYYEDTERLFQHVKPQYPIQEVEE